MSNDTQNPQRPAAQPSAPTTLDGSLVREIAVSAECSPGPVYGYFRGAVVRPSIARRIARALAQLGIADPRSADTTTAAPRPRADGDA